MISTSAFGKRSRTAASSSAVVSTFTSSTPAGGGIVTFAARRVTSAPRLAASSASARPMRPDDRFPMKRTESIGSRVPPAVTRTFRPSSERGLYWPPDSTSSITPRISAGSASLPTPHSPFDASRPVPGSTTRAPRERSSSRFAWVAGCSYMRLFIAGATTSGATFASAALVSRLSASPVASFASVLAEAGATTNTSARATSSRWEIGLWSDAGSPGNAPRAGSASNSSTSTGAPVTPSNVARPTKFRLAGVWMTRTEWPAPVASRTSSTALYAAIPPLTPSRIRAKYAS